MIIACWQIFASFHINVILAKSCIFGGRNIARITIVNGFVGSSPTAKGHGSRGPFRVEFGYQLNHDPVHVCMKLTLIVTMVIHFEKLACRRTGKKKKQKIGEIPGRKNAMACTFGK